MGVAERDAARGEILRKIGREHLRVARLFEHPGGDDLHAVDREPHRVEREPRGFGRGEDRWLRLLEVAVVAEREPLERPQEIHELARHARRLTADQLDHIGVLLLRHDGRARAELVGQLDEPELGRRPVDQVLRHLREVGHEERAGGDELDGVIAIAHRVD